MGVLCTWMKLLRDLHILGCELHKNELGGRTPPGIAGGAIAPAIPLTVIRRRGQRKREGKGWNCEWDGSGGRKGVGRDGKGERES